MSTSIYHIRHPEYLYNQREWQLWRDTYLGGEHFVTKYLEKYTARESTSDYNTRRDITPIPTFAKAAVNDIRNAIYQRMSDVSRVGGSRIYQQAIQGNLGGVDKHGSGMDAFLGFDALTELLTMGRVGIYVDNTIAAGSTLADAPLAKPYLYTYRVEDILSWTQSRHDETSEFQAVLLRDRVIDYTTPENLGMIHKVLLPQGEMERMRLVYIDPITKMVNVQFYNNDSVPVDPVSNEPTNAGPIQLNMKRIPFVMLDIGQSLLTDVCKHQIALLNLCSSDVAYALKANFPFYVEQKDMRDVGSHLKLGNNPDNTASDGGQGGKQNEIEIGPTQGRSYDMGTDRPGFIHPSSEPLEASIKLQEKLEDDIRKLVNLAVANKTGRAISGNSKEMDNQGLEAGLSFIGLVLENAERKIASYWATYEHKEPLKRDVATVKYPSRYSLKKDSERIEEAEKLTELMTTVPGHKIKRELAKIVVSTLLGGRVSVEDLQNIYTEIETAPYTTSDPEIIIPALEAGLVGEKVGSMALGFGPDEYKQARKDHMERIKRIAESQAKGLGAGAEAEAEAKAGARGVKDFSSDPKEGVIEREDATDTTLADSTKKPVRGKGKSNKGDS
jgi:hypothetical protein